MPTKLPVIHSDPEILSGTPVFVGTRVPVQSLFDYLEGGDTLDEFLSSFRRSDASKPLPLSNSPARAWWPVRVLLDENIPHDLIPQFAGHDVSTVQGLAGRASRMATCWSVLAARSTCSSRWIANWKSSTTSPSCLSVCWSLWPSRIECRSPTPRGRGCARPLERIGPRSGSST